MYVTEVKSRGGKVRNRTVANLTNLPPNAIEAVRLALKGGVVASPDDTFEVEQSRHHGHVHAVMTAMDKLGIKKLLASTPSRQRDLVIAMIAARILDPKSKLETTRARQTTTLPQSLDIADADEDELYTALDLLRRSLLPAREARLQPRQEARQAAGQLRPAR